MPIPRSVHLFALPLLLFPILSAQTTIPATQPAATPAELARLRAENAELRTEIAALKAQLAAAAQTQPAKKEIPRPFTSMTDILEKTPADLRPQAKAEWFKFTESKFLDWVKPQVVGMTFEANLHYAGGNTMHNVVNQHPGAEWMLNGSFDSQHFTYFGADHQLSVHLPYQYFDEAAAKKWDAVKKGTLIKVTGVIQEMSITRKNYGSSQLPQYQFTLTLRDMEITPPK